MGRKQVGPAASGIAVGAGVYPAAGQRGRDLDNINSRQILTFDVADAISDGVWFDQNPERQYRLRQSSDGRFWAVRNRSGIFLRGPVAAAAVGDSEDERVAEANWRASAWPDFDPDQGRKAAKRPRRRAQ